MSAKKVREKLEKRLGRQVPDDVWKILEKNQFIHAAETDGEIGLRDLAKAARKLIRQRKGLEPVQSSTNPTMQSRSHDYARALAFAEYKASAVMEYFPELVRLWDRLFESEPLRHGAAQRLLRSPLARAIDLRRLRKSKIPIVEHQSKVDSDGKILVVSTEKKFQVLGLPTREIRFRDRDSQNVCLAIWKGTALHEIEKLSSKIAKNCALDPEDAVEVVLTGIIPPLLGFVTLQVLEEAKNTPPRAQIVIRAEAWCSAGEIAKQYSWLQKQISGKNRSPSMRNLDVFRLVTRVVSNSGGKRPPWSKLRDLWNKDNPEESYSETRLFRRDYERVRKLLLEPEYCFDWHQKMIERTHEVSSKLSEEEIDKLVARAI